jgi:hypothetical protein
VGRILLGGPRSRAGHTREGCPCFGKHESPSSLDAVPKGINPKEQRGAGYCEAAAAVCPLADLQRKAPETETDARMRSRRVSLLRGRAQPLGSVGASDRRLDGFHRLSPRRRTGAQYGQHPHLGGAAY